MFGFGYHLCMGVCLLTYVAAPHAAWAQAAQPRAQEKAGTRVLTPQEIEAIFPPSVFFRAKTAPVQFRNASAVRFPDGRLFFAGLIDSSGYASQVRETYQMYLLCERSFTIGDKTLPAGSYGAGFVDTHFVVMDLGGATLAEGPTELDEHLQRPRPLQVLDVTALGVRLYLGRRWVSISPATK